jgi:dolichol-phosphate mannosyltransferase
METPKIIKVNTQVQEIPINRISPYELNTKIHSEEQLKKLHLESQRFDFEPEITAKILKLGYHIKEVPIEYYPRGFSDGKKISWKDGIRALFVLIKWRFKK